MFRPQKFTATKTRPADTTNYAAEDVISENATNGAGTTWEFTGARMSPGELRGARLYADMEVTPRLILHLYTSAAPTNVELDDNAQFGIMYEAEDEKVGEINFPATAGEDATVGNGVRAQNFDLRIPIVQSTSSPNLYGILETLDAFQPGNAANITIDLFIGSGE